MKGLDKVLQDRSDLPLTYDHHTECQDIQKDTMWFADELDRNMREKELRIAEVQ
jgi:hypothetical protein